jgi:ABC-type multidrug transport system fused ATPase/permease subunit
MIIGKLYLQVSREFKRLNSVSRSPIYSHFSETLVGVSTIRAYGAQDRFMREMIHRLDEYTASFYLLWMSNRWLYCRIELTGAIVTLAAGVFILLKFGSIDAGLAGLSLTFSRSFLEGVYWFVRQYTQVEMNLNSVERVQEYLEIEQEPPYVIEGHEPPAAWPTTAAVEIQDLVIQYAPDLDPVIKNISFDIRPHEKVGVVGRTGSGKSTLALSLFRFVDPSSGHIKIDGIDITLVKTCFTFLHVLMMRQTLTLILL